MKLVTAGQLIRIVGLACELLGLVGVWRVSSSGVDAVPAIFGANPDSTFKVLVVCGFALWLTGRTMISMSRVRESRWEQGEGGRGENDLRL